MLAASASWAAAAASAATASVRATTARAGHKVWQLHLKPALSVGEAVAEALFGSGWTRLRGAAAGIATSAAAVLQSGAAGVQQGAAAALASAEAWVLRQLQASPALAAAAQPALVHWGLVLVLLAALAPAALALARATWRGAVHLLRPGSAVVKAPTVGSQLNALETRLGHRFETTAPLKAAFADAGGRLSWLGAAAARAAAAADAYRSCGEDAPAGELQRAADAALAAPAQAAAAQRAGASAYVAAGPGRRSAPVAGARAVALHQALVGAAFLDSGFDLGVAAAAFRAGPVPEKQAALAPKAPEAPAPSKPEPAVEAEPEVESGRESDAELKAPGSEAPDGAASSEEGAGSEAGDDAN